MNKKMMVKLRLYHLFTSIEHIMSIIVSLFKHLSAEPLQRTLNKFTEENYQKVERLIELHEKCILTSTTV
jgi:beta-catenin-like protein 1